MSSDWNLLPSISIKYNQNFAQLLETATKPDPFASLPWLLQSNRNGPSGILRSDGLIIPYKFLTDSCIGLGGYVFSEMQQAAFSVGNSSDLNTQLTDLPHWLASQGIHGVFIEADEDCSKTHALRNALQDAQWDVHSTPGSLKPFIVLPKGTDFPDFDTLLRSINKKEYRSLQAARRKLSQQAFYIEKVNGTITDNAILQCKEIEDGSWKAGKGIFADSKLDGTTQILKGCETLTSILHINDTAAAWDIDIIHNNTLYSYNRAFKEEFRQYVPGKVLHYANIEEAWKRGITHFELLGTADAFKSRFANQTHSRVRIAAFSKHATGRALTTGFSMYSKAKPYIKKLRSGRSH